jgi:hypothetical protein
LLLNRAFVIFGIVAIMAASAVARPDRNAFIEQKVNTTSELVNHVKRNPGVMDRYMRHYGMTRAEVIAYLSTLRPSTIQEEGVYTVYSVPEGGKIRLNLQRLKKGRTIFVMPDGNPELVMLCGNPMTLGPKQVVALNRTPVTTTEVVADEVPVTILTETESEATPLTAMQPKEPVYTFTTPPVIDETPIPIPVSGGFNPWPLALGGLAFIDNGGGTAVVPEPMSMAAFGAGLALLGLRRRRNKK